MTGFYDRATATAQRLLEKFGRPWVFTRTDSAGAVTTHSAVGCFIDTVRHVLGDSGVAIGDLRFIFTADAAPQNGDRMANADQSYVVMHTDPIGDTTCAYWLWARAG
jgi:hypothetical protein